MAEGKMGSAGLFAKRVQKQLSRAQEKVLQKLGKTVETKDEQFEQSAYHFQQQQAEGHKLYKDLKAFLSAVKVMHESSKKVAETLQDIYDTEWDGFTDLKDIAQSNDLLWEDYEEKLADQAITMMEAYLTQFNEIKEQIAKRGRKLVDYDSNRHHLEALQNAKKKDEAKIAKAEEEFYKAQAVFEELNKELREELPVLYNSRIACYVTIFQNISNLRDIFYKEMSKLNHDLYEVMSKLEKQHSNKVFIIKGVPSNRGSLVISSPVSPVSSFSLPSRNSVSEIPPSPPITSPNHTGESVSATEAESTHPILREAEAATEEEGDEDEEEEEGERPTSLVPASKNEVAVVSASNSLTTSEGKDDNQAMELEKISNISRVPPLRVEEVANNLAVEILTEAVLEAAGKGQDVHQDSEAIHSQGGDSYKKEPKGSILFGPQQAFQIEESHDEKNALVSRESTVCPDSHLQVCPSEDLTNGSSLPSQEPDTPGETTCQPIRDAEENGSSDGSIEERDVSPKVTKTQVKGETISSFFSENKQEDNVKLPLGFRFKGQTIKAHTSDAENHLQFEEGETILVLLDAQAQAKGFLMGVKENDWKENQDMVQKGIFPADLIQSTTLD